MFNLDDYETVEERLTKFWKDHPDGQIHTQLIDSANSRFIVMASIFRTEADARPWTSGLAEETIQGRGVNATSALENCETSAIGRALANAGYATKGKRPSMEEMQKVQRAAEVKTQVNQVKAKMAQTSGEYVPVPVESDPWTVQVAAPPQTMEQAVETVKSILGGTTDKDLPRCQHGEMVWKTGTTKANKSYGMFKCNPPHGTSNYCDPIWYEIAKDGTWQPQVKRG
jgi:hypothetical protein